MSLNWCESVRTTTAFRTCVYYYERTETNVLLSNIYTSASVTSRFWRHSAALHLQLCLVCRLDSNISHSYRRSITRFAASNYRFIQGRRLLYLLAESCKLDNMKYRFEFSEGLFGNGSGAIKYRCAHSVHVSTSGQLHCFFSGCISVFSCIIWCHLAWN